MIIKMSKQICRSKQEIAEELRLLRSLVDKIPAVTILGDSNHEAIDAETHVISAELTMEQVLNKYEDGDEYTLCFALGALEWLYDGASAPSEDWIEMVAA